MATENTDWPSPTFPESVKNLINHFYGLIESQADDTGSRLANEFFTPSGVMQGGSQKFTGREELIASRASAWDHIASRKHTIQKVFAGDIQSVGSDVMMIGKLDLVLKNGAAVAVDFTTRIVVDDPSAQEPKIALCQVWADSAPLVRAIAGIDQAIVE